MIIKIFLAGWAVLIAAILLNLIAGRLGIESWYPFVEQAGKDGFLKAFSKASFISKLFLFVIYPALLGLTAYLSFKLFR
jgi:hypothetical protein